MITLPKAHKLNIQQIQIRHRNEINDEVKDSSRKHQPINRLPELKNIILKKKKRNIDINKDLTEVIY